jgi:hypothetical protein
MLEEFREITKEGYKAMNYVFILENVENDLEEPKGKGK